MRIHRYRYTLFAAILNCILSGSFANGDNIFEVQEEAPSTEVSNEPPISRGVANPQDEFLFPFIVGELVNYTISSDPLLSELQPRKVVRRRQGRRTRRTYRLRHKGATYIALHFESMNIQDGCKLVVRDRPGVQKYVLQGQDKMGLPQFWARLIIGDTVILSLICNRKNSIGEFQIDQYAAGFKDLSNGGRSGSRNLRGADDLPPWERERQLTICSANDKLNAQCYKDSHPTEYKKSRAVAKIVIQGVGVCTGWLVGNSNVLVTNSHCISSTSRAINANYIFNLEVQNGGGDCTQQQGNENIASGVAEFYTAESFLYFSRTHDYALIRLSGSPSEKYGFLETEPRETGVGEEIYVPQHPRGFDKEIAIHDSEYGADQRCRTLQPVVACYDFRSPGYLDVRYTCDTEGGSSGSPVISAVTNKVIALHHCGEISTCSGNEGVPMTFLHDDFIRWIGDGSLPPTQSALQCQGDQYEVLLELQTDFFGYETTFELRASVGDVVVEEGKDLYFRSSEAYSFQYCLPKVEYTLTIEDSYQDGMCCQHGSGSYTLYLDGQLVATGGDFQSSVAIEFGADFGSTQVTDSPTSGPTSNPTSEPTSPPTSGPTSKPTSKPTSSPTSRPTSSPTSRPTSGPTSRPTSGPTSNPTSIPTLTPTSGPTSTPTSGQAETTKRPTFNFFPPNIRVGFDGPREAPYATPPVTVDGPNFYNPPS